MLSWDYEISCDPERIDRSLVHEFLRGSYWAEGRSRETVERSIKHSLCFGVYAAEQQIAFARVVTDRAVFAYLADVFVVPEFCVKGTDAHDPRSPRPAGSAHVLVGNARCSRTVCPVRFRSYCGASAANGEILQCHPKRLTTGCGA